MSNGTINRDVWEIVLANVRTPDEREGDLSAMIGANRTGERRLREIVSKYGWNEVSRYVAAILDYTERMTRQAISQIHNGIYEAEDFLDDEDRKSTRLNSSHLVISYAVFCLKKKKKKQLRDSVYYCHHTR